MQEGVLHLEGPVAFVQHYLDIYQSAVKGLHGISEGITATKESQTSARNKSRKAKRVSCGSGVREQFEAGFFAEPRSIRETKQRLIEKGMTCTAESIRMALNRLYTKGLVDRVKKGGLVRYHRKG